MYNSYLGQQPQPQPQQPLNPQGFQSAYQLPQQTGYQPPPLQQQQQQQQPLPQPTGPITPQQQQFLQGQAATYGSVGPATGLAPGQYSGVPPVPAIPSQYASQAQPTGIQLTGFPQQQYGSFAGPSIQQPPPQSQPAQSPAATGHRRNTSTATGTSTRIPNGLLTPEGSLF